MYIFYPFCNHEGLPSKSYILNNGLIVNEYRVTMHFCNIILKYKIWLQFYKYWYLFMDLHMELTSCFVYFRRHTCNDPFAIIDY